MSDDDLPLKDSKHILLRAAEIDSVASETISLRALRDAARQAGIAEESFHQALEEHRLAQAELEQRAIRRRRLIWRVAIAGGAFTVIDGLLFLLAMNTRTTPRGFPPPSAQSSPRPDSAAT